MYKPNAQPIEEVREALEVLQKRARSRKSISSPTDIYAILLPNRSCPQEQFFVLLLDGAHQLIKKILVSKGLVNRTVVHPREVFRSAIKYNAVAIAIAHNHPSGRLEPSPEDRDITAQLCKAGKIIGITVIDHIIFGKASYYSFAKHGILTEQEEE